MKQSTLIPRAEPQLTYHGIPLFTADDWRFAAEEVTDEVAANRALASLSDWFEQDGHALWRTGLAFPTLLWANVRDRLPRIPVQRAMASIVMVERGEFVIQDYWLGLLSEEQLAKLDLFLAYICKHVPQHDSRFYVITEDLL